MSDDCPRVLINRDKAGGGLATLTNMLGLGGSKLLYDKKGNSNILKDAQQLRNKEKRSELILMA